MEGQLPRGHFIGLTMDYWTPPLTDNRLCSSSRIQTLNVWGHDISFDDIQLENQLLKRPVFLLPLLLIPVAALTYDEAGLLVTLI